MKRALTLRRETVRELTSDELGAVVGGDSVLSVGSCPLRDCVIPQTRFTCSPTCTA